MRTQPQRGQAAEISGHVGTALESPFAVTWDTTWIPDQPEGSIRLIARVQGAQPMLGKNWSCSGL